jgi:hypothetical protein
VLHFFLSTWTETFLGIYATIILIDRRADLTSTALLLIGYVVGYFFVGGVISQVWKKRGYSAKGCCVIMTVVLFQLFTLMVMLFAALFLARNNKAVYFDTYDVRVRW